MSLERFKTAQRESYARALREITEGRKQSHWMWYIFPQLRGLGHSPMAIEYGIDGGAEAEEYYRDPLLRERLLEICRILLRIDGRSALEVMGHPDDKKLRSCLTLFETVQNADPVFGQLLEKYYGGERDRRTLAMLK